MGKSIEAVAKTAPELRRIRRKLFRKVVLRLPPAWNLIVASSVRQKN